MGESDVSQQSLPAVAQDVINEEQQQLDRDHTTVITFKQRVSGVLRGWVLREAYTLIKLAVPVVGRIAPQNASTAPPSPDTHFGVSAAFAICVNIVCWSYQWALSRAGQCR